MNTGIRDDNRATISTLTKRKSAVHLFAAQLPTIVLRDICRHTCDVWTHCLPASANIETNDSTRAGQLPGELLLRKQLRDIAALPENAAERASESRRTTPTLPSCVCSAHANSQLVSEPVYLSAVTRPRTGVNDCAPTTRLIVLHLPPLFVG